jgi:hypothetical protein
MSVLSSGFCRLVGAVVNFQLTNELWALSCVSK